MAMFLKLDGVDGESTDAKHKDEIDIESFSWGLANPSSATSGGGGGAGKVSVQDFHFVMRQNVASPKLILACATGEHIKKATLTVRKAGKEQQEYLKVTMEDLLVSSYQTGGSAAEPIPTDQFSLNFSKVEYSYSPQSATGALGSPVVASIDLRRGGG